MTRTANGQAMTQGVVTNHLLQLIAKQVEDRGLVVWYDPERAFKPVRSLAEPLQVAMDNGARRALVPLENKRNFLDVSGDIVERVDPVFFSDPMTAAMKALGMT
jgi:predicted ATP-dependent Lon-type protease